MLAYKNEYPKVAQCLRNHGADVDTQHESIVGIEFNPVNVGFNSDASLVASSNNSNDDDNNGYSVYFRDVLNQGIKPDLLIDMVKNKFSITITIIIIINIIMIFSYVKWSAA